MALCSGTNKPGFPVRRNPLPVGDYRVHGGPVVLNIPAGLGDRRIVVDKTKERIRFENETESEVTVIIERKG